MIEQLKQLKAQGVRYLLTQFVDIHGIAKGKLIPIDHAASVFTLGAGFAGPSIWGTELGRFGDYSEFYGRGDMDTRIQILPWQPEVARVVCDGYVNSEPFLACPRIALKTQIARLAKHGLTLQVGIEPEFFIFNQGTLTPPDAGDVLDKPSYDLKALFKQPAFGFVDTLSQYLQALDFDVVQIDHEDAPGQYEVNYTYDHALAAADRLMMFKLAAHASAQAHGLDYSMMPKPFADRPGSGLHFHVSMTDAQGRNVFEPSAGELLSAIGQQAMAGVLRHAHALTALHCPIVNSYKRLVIGNSLSGTTWAPVFVAHGYNNRTCIARSLKGRFEWRVPDSSANVYLALAGLIAAVLDGIENKIPLGASQDYDLTELSPTQRAEKGITVLPQTLGQACDALEGDAYLCAALGDVSQHFLKLKRMEWTSYNQHVSEWEVSQYRAYF